MPLKLREQAIRKKRIQADFAEWAERLKPTAPQVSLGTQPTEVRRGVPTRIAEGEAPEERDTAAEQAQALTEIIRAPAIEEPELEVAEPAPVLEEVAPGELAQELGAVPEPPDRGGFDWYSHARAIVDGSGVENPDAAIFVMLAVIQTRSGGNEKRVFGDSVGLFGASRFVKPRIEAELRKRGDLGADDLMLPEEFQEWRMDPLRQLDYYGPLVVRYYQRGIQEGIYGRDLAEYVGKKLEEGAPAVEGAYAQSYDEVVKIALDWLREENGGELPDELRTTPFADGKTISGEPTGLTYRPGTIGEEDVTAPRKVYMPVADMPLTLGQVGDDEPWYEKAIRWASPLWLVPKQWVGMMYQSGEVGQMAVEKTAARLDPWYSLVGALGATVSSVPAFVWGLAGPKTLNMEDMGFWDSLGARATRGVEAGKSRIERAVEIAIPSYPGMAVTEEGWTFEAGYEEIRRRNEEARQWWEDRRDMPVDFGSGIDPRAFLRDPKWIKGAFISGSNQWTEEERDYRWDGGKDFSYTHIFDHEARDNYFKDRAAVEEHINFLRAKDGLPPRRLKYREIEEIKARWENPTTEMLGEIIFDLLNLADMPFKFVWGFSTGLLRPEMLKFWKGVIGKPKLAALFSEATRYTALKYSGLFRTVLNDLVGALDGMVPPSVKPDDAVKWVDDLVNMQSDKNPVTLALKLKVGAGEVVWPGLTGAGRTINLATDTAERGLKGLYHTFNQVALGEVVPRRSAWGGSLFRSQDSPLRQGLDKWWVRRAEKATRGGILRHNIHNRLKRGLKVFDKNPYWTGFDNLDEALIDAAGRIGDEVGERADWENLALADKTDAILGKLQQKELVPEFLRRHGVPAGRPGKKWYYDADGLRVNVDQTFMRQYFGEWPSAFKKIWIEANLSARPGFTLRNVMDTTFRALVGGGFHVFTSKIDEIIRRSPIPQQLYASFGGMEIGASAQMMLEKKRMPKIWKLGDWIEALNKISENAAKRTVGGEVSATRGLPWPLGSSLWDGDIWVKGKRFNLSLATGIEMARDWNEAFEVMMRLRVYDRLYQDLYSRIYTKYHAKVLRMAQVGGVGGAVLRKVLNMKPKRPEDLRAFLEATLKGEGLLADLYVPERISMIAEAPEYLKRAAKDAGIDVSGLWDSKKVDEFQQEVAAKFYESWLKNKELTPDAVKKIFAEAEKDLAAQAKQLEADLLKHIDTEPGSSSYGRMDDDGSTKVTPTPKPSTGGPSAAIKPQSTQPPVENNVIDTRGSTPRSNRKAHDNFEGQVALLRKAFQGERKRITIVDGLRHFWNNWVGQFPSPRYDVVDVAVAPWAAGLLKADIGDAWKYRWELTKLAEARISQRIRDVLSVVAKEGKFRMQGTAADVKKMLDDLNTTEGFLSTVVGPRITNGDINSGNWGTVADLATERGDEWLKALQNALPDGEKLNLNQVGYLKIETYLDTDQIPLPATTTRKDMKGLVPEIKVVFGPLDPNKLTEHNFVAGHQSLKVLTAGRVRRDIKGVVLPGYGLVLGKGPDPQHLSMLPAIDVPLGEKELGDLDPKEIIELVLDQTDNPPVVPTVVREKGAVDPPIQVDGETAKNISNNDAARNPKAWSALPADMTDHGLKDRINRRLEILGQLDPDGRPIVLSDEAVAALEADKKELNRRLHMKLHQKGPNALTKYERGLLTLEQFFGDAEKIVQETELMQLRETLPAVADRDLLRTYISNIVPRMTFSDFVAERGSNILPELAGNILPTGRANDIKNITKLLAGGPYEVAKIQQFTWEALDALAFLNGVSFDVQTGTKGAKEMVARKLVAMQGLDEAFANFSPTLIQKIRRGESVALRQVDEAVLRWELELYYKDLYGLTAEKLAEEQTADIVMRLAGRWQEMAQERSLRRARSNYLHHIGTALLAPDANLSDEVLMSALDVERTMVLRYGDKYKKGFSLEFVEPWNQPVAYQVFNKLDIRPEDLISFERFHLEDWDHVVSQTAGKDLHYSVTAAKERLRELAYDVNEKGGLVDNRTRYGIMRHNAEGTAIYEVVRKTLPEGVQPWQLTFDDFLIWFRGNGGQVVNDLGERAPLLTTLAARGGISGPWVSRGMNEAQLFVYETARKARYDVLRRAAVVEGHNVPEIFLREFGDTIISEQQRVHHDILTTLPETSIPRRWGEPQRQAKWRDLAEFYEILQWNIDNVVDASWEKLSKSHYAAQVAEIRELKKGVTLPQYAELVLALDATRINVEFDLHLIKQVRKAINHLRGTRGFQIAGDRKVSKFMAYALEAKKVGAPKVAAEWERIENYTRELLTILDDKIFSKDGAFYDNSEIIARSWLDEFKDTEGVLNQIQRTRFSETRKMVNRPTYSEMRKFMDALRAPGASATPKEWRTRVAAELLATTSRISAISKLDWIDVWLPKEEGGTAFIWLHDKKMKRKIEWPGYKNKRIGGTAVPLSDEAKEALFMWRTYLSEKALAPTGKVFDITDTTMRNHLQAVAEKAGVMAPNKQFQPHDIRRYSAIHNFNISGGDMKFVQEFLRHKDAVTTVLYLRALPSPTLDMDEALAVFIGEHPKLRHDLEKTHARLKASVDSRREGIRNTDFSDKWLMPDIEKGTDEFQDRLGRVKANWGLLLRSEEGKGLIKRYEILFPGKGLLSDGELLDDFLAEVTRRSKAEAQDWHVFRRMLATIDDQYAAVLNAHRRNTVGALREMPPVGETLANHLYFLSDEVALLPRGAAVDYLEGPATFKGWVLVQPSTNTPVQAGVWETQAQAQDAVEAVQRVMGISDVAVKEIDEYIDTPWRDILGEDYDNWRRMKWLGAEGDDIRSKHYPEIMAAIESRYPVGPRAHRRGLEEIHPYLEGPLSWHSYLADVENREALLANLVDYPPRRIETPEVIQNQMAKAGTWRGMLQKGKKFVGTTLPAVGDTPYVLVAPNRGYQLVPINDYEGKSRKWVAGHVSGWEGVEMEWRVPKRGYDSFESGTYVLTNDTHFHAADEISKQLQSRSWAHNAPVLGDETKAVTYITAGNEAYRARLAIVDIGDLKPQYWINNVDDVNTLVHNYMSPEWMNITLPESPEMAAQVLGRNAENLNPHSLLEDATVFGKGLPVVDGFGNVLDGSGRVNMLQLAEDAASGRVTRETAGMDIPKLEESWSNYREATRGYLSRYGFTDKQLDALKDAGARPVVVRILTEPLNKHQVMRVIRRANPRRLIGDTEALLEIAQQDIKVIRNFMVDAGGAPVDEGEFFNALKASDGPAPYGEAENANALLQDRLVRAVMVDLFGEENILEAHKLANLYMRDNDVFVQTTIQGIVENYQQLTRLHTNIAEDLVGKEFRMLEKIANAADFFSKARVQFPDERMDELVELLLSGQSQWYSTVLNSQPEVRDIVRLVAKTADIEPAALGDAISSYLDIVENNIIRVEGEPIIGGKPEEIFRDAIRTRIPTGHAYGSSTEKVRVLGERADDWLRLGQAGAAPEGRQLAIRGPGTGELVPDEPNEAWIMRLFAEAGHVSNYDPVDSEMYRKIYETIQVAAEQSGPAKARLKNFTIKELAAKLEAPEVVDIGKMQGAIEDILTIINANVPLGSRPIQPGVAGAGVFTSLSDPALRGQEGRALVEEALSKHIARQLDRSWTPVEEAALHSVMSGSEILEILNDGLQGMRYEDLQNFWAVVTQRLLNEGLPEPLEVGPLAYKQWNSVKQDFILTDEGKEVVDKVFAAIAHGESIPAGDQFRVPEIIGDAEIEMVVAQLNDVIWKWFNPEEWHGVGKPGKPWRDLYGRLLYAKTIKGAYAPSMAADLMLDIVRKQVVDPDDPKYYSGLGKFLGAGQEKTILEKLSGGPLFGGEPQFKIPDNLKNIFHYADLYDGFWANAARVVPAELKEEWLLERGFSNAQHMVDSLNQVIRRMNEERIMAWDHFPDAWKIFSAKPVQYTLDTPVPQRFIDELILERQGVIDKGLEPSKAFKKNSGHMLGRWNTPCSFPCISGPPVAGAAGFSAEDARTLAQRQLKAGQAMIKMWRRIMLGKGGTLGDVLPVDKAARDWLMSFVEQEHIPSLHAIRNTAMFGTTDDTAFIGTLGIPDVPVGNTVDDPLAIADRNFEVAVTQWSGKDFGDLDAFDGMTADGLEEAVQLVEGNFGPGSGEAYRARWAEWRKTLEREPVRWGKTLTREALPLVERMKGKITPAQLEELAPGFYKTSSNPFYTAFQRFLPEQRLSPVQGAVDRTGDIMIDYASQANIDQMMKWLFPFWVFPTRSLKFWSRTLATNPEILATTAKLQNMSERLSYDVGAITTKGEQLPRFRGHFQLGKSNWWFNPLAALSYTQAIPNYRSVSYEDPDPEAHPMQQAVTYLLAQGPRAGFHLAPWIHAPLTWEPLNLIGNEEFPRRSWFGQLDLVPPYTQRWAIKKVNDIMSTNFDPELGWTPEVSWKDFLIERQLLVNLQNEMAALDDFAKEQLVDEAMVAIATRAGERYDKARKDLEKSEQYARMIGYFTGIYGKEYSQGEEELYAARDHATKLRREIARDAGVEEFYKDYRYNTAEGMAYGLYSTISHVSDEEGKQLYGAERWAAVQEQLSQQQAHAGQIAATAGARRMVELELAGLAVGTPYEVRKPIYDTYTEAKEEIAQKFPGVTIDWGPYNKHDDTIRKYVVDKWMNLLGETRPQWDKALHESWDNYQLAVQEWEMLLPERAYSLIGLLLEDLAGEKLNLDVTDEKTGETTNKFTELYGPRPKARQLLLSMANGEQWNAWDKENDDLYDAMNRVVRDNYWSAFWDYLGDSSGMLRDQREEDYKLRYPNGVPGEKVVEWVQEAYPDKWDDETIQMHFYGRETLEIDEIRMQGNTPREDEADDIYMKYGWAGPKKTALFDALDTDMRDALRDFLDPSRKSAADRGLWQFWSDDFWKRFHMAFDDAVQELELDKPTRAQLDEWVEAEGFNKEFEAYREMYFGPDWAGENRRYGEMSSRAQEEWREEFPDDYARLKAGWLSGDLAKDFGRDYPIWQKYYDSQEYERIYGVVEGVKAPVSTSGGVSGVGSMGMSSDDMYHYAVGPGFLRSDYKGVTIEQLQKTPSARGPMPWPTIQISSLALNEILSGTISAEVEKYLRVLKNRVNPYLSYEDFIERLRKLAEAKAQSRAGSEQESKWLWQVEEGYDPADVGKLERGAWLA